MSGFYLPSWIIWFLSNFWTVVAVLATLGGYGIYLFVRWILKR